jgi:hypothetical protein
LIIANGHRPRRGSAHRRQHRQAAGAAAAEGRQPIEVPAACIVRDHAGQALPSKIGHRIRFSNGRRGSVTYVGRRTRRKLVAPSIAATVRYEPRVESGLRELIADAEERLDLLERQKVPQSK